MWTSDLHRINRCIREIEAGNVWANTYLQTRYELPFAGVKESGYGHDEVEEFSREKAAVIALVGRGAAPVMARHSIDLEA